MYHTCSKNKGTDQLRGYHEADLRLLFSHMQIVGFPMGWLKSEKNMSLCGSFLKSFTLELRLEKRVFRFLTRSDRSLPVQKRLKA